MISPLMTFIGQETNDKTEKVYFNIYMERINSINNNDSWRMFFQTDFQRILFKDRPLDQSQTSINHTLKFDQIHDFSLPYFKEALRKPKKQIMAGQLSPLIIGWAIKKKLFLAAFLNRIERIEQLILLQRLFHTNTTIYQQRPNKIQYTSY